MPLLALALALVGTSSTAAAASKAPRGRLLGVVPHRGHVSRLAPASRQAALTTNLTYHGGPVMHTNKTYAIYWKPTSYASDYSSTFKPLVNEFLADVAADSTKRTNVYASDTQYDDTTGHVRYSSTFGGALNDTTAFPSATCHATLSQCVTDAQIQTRVNDFVTANNLPRGLGTLYFVFTPPGIVVCDGTSAAATCSDSPTGFCAYHGDFGSGASKTLYAVHPYPDLSGCDPGQSPNSDAEADAQINVISHEHNEAITDPQFSPAAWYDDTTGEENGDKCAWTFGTTLGGPAGAHYNQQINGHGYWLQLEWSNHDSGCVQEFPDLKPTATFSLSPNPASTGQQVSFNVTGVSDPDSDVTGYSWDFGDGTTGSDASAQHAYSSGGTFTVTLTVIDNDGATPTTTHTVTVTAPSSGAPPNNGPPGNTESTTSTGNTPTTTTTIPVVAPVSLASPTIAFLASQRTIATTRRGYFSYSLTGTPAGARGRISFGTVNAITAAGRRRKLNLGAGSFTLSGAGRGKVTLKLSRTNLAILKRKRSLLVRATVTVGSVTRTVRFTLKAPKR